MTSLTQHSPRARLTALPRLPVWAFAAGVVALGVLMVFQQVVQASVQQAERRRADLASQGDATWRCKALPAKDVRDCLDWIRPIANP